MIKELIAIANSLDSKGFKKEADYLDSIITKAAGSWDDDDWREPSDEELEKLMEEEEDIEKDAETITAEEVLSASMSFIHNPNVDSSIRKAFKKKIVDIIGLELMAHGELGMGGRMRLGRPGIAPTTLPIAEAKKKPTKKQLKALDLDGDEEITGKDFKLLGRRNKKSKK